MIIIGSEFCSNAADRQNVVFMLSFFDMPFRPIPAALRGFQIITRNPLRRRQKSKK